MYCLVPGNGFARGGSRQASFVIDIARCRPKPAKHGVKKDRGFLACQLLCGCGGADDVSQWKSATKLTKFFVPLSAKFGNVARVASTKTRNRTIAPKIQCHALCKT